MKVSNTISEKLIKFGFTILVALFLVAGHLRPAAGGGASDIVYNSPVQVSSGNTDSTLYGYNSNDGGHVVWYASDGAHYQIYYYDGTSVKPITNTAYDNKNPLINNNDQIVWQGYSGSTPQIFFYNGSTITQITDNSYSNGNPRINDNGDIAWDAGSGSGTSASYQIYTYTNATGVTTQITPSGDNRVSWFSNDGEIVFQNFNTAHTLYQVYLYDGDSFRQLSNNTSVPSTNNWAQARINADGEVIWRGWDGHDWEIYMYNGGTTYRLTTNDYDDVTPRNNLAGDVVWSGYDGSHWQIYLYRGGTTTPITNNAYDNLYPFINNGNNITWWGGNSTTGYNVYNYVQGDIVQVTIANYASVNGVPFTSGTKVTYNASDGSHLQTYQAARQPTGYSTYYFNYYYKDGSGDHYYGWVVAPSGWFSVGSTLNNQPDSMGGAPLNGYYEIVAVYDNSPASKDKQSEILEYFDNSTGAGWGLNGYGVNGDGSSLSQGLYVTDRSTAAESGYFLSGSIKSAFDTTTSTDLSVFLIFSTGYQATYTGYNETNPTNTWTATMDCTGSTTFDGALWYTFAGHNYLGDNSTNYLISDGINLYVYENGTKKPIFKALPAGSTWIYMEEYGTTATATIESVASYTGPAGTFNNVYKVHIVSSDWEEYYYWKPGHGLLEEIDYSVGDAHYRDHLQLTSYTLPGD